MKPLIEQRIAVTGGTGLVGSHIVAELLREGCKVELLMRDCSRIAPLKKRLEELNLAHFLDRLTLTEVALNNPIVLNRVLNGVETIFHCAATVSYDPARAQEIISSNTEMTASLVDVALQQQVGRFVHISSIATLGEPCIGEKQITEATHLTSLMGRSPYSISKFYAENEVWRGSTQGLPVVILNPAIILGEGDWGNSSGQLVAFGAHGNIAYTRGVKGYVDVRDVARAARLLAEEQQAVGQRFILSAANLSFRQLFTRISLVAHRCPPLLPVGATLLRLAARFEAGRCAKRGAIPKLTTETIANAQDCSYYDGSAVTRLIPFTYTPIRVSIDRVTRQYLRDTTKKTE